jgi:hypothetical protein
MILISSDKKRKLSPLNEESRPSKRNYAKFDTSRSNNLGQGSNKLINNGLAEVEVGKKAVADIKEIKHVNDKPLLTETMPKMKSNPFKSAKDMYTAEVRFFLINCS